jgi:peroxiredoxin
MDEKNYRSNSSRREKVVARRHHDQIRNYLLIGGGFIVFIAFIFLSFSKSSNHNVSLARIGVKLGDFALTDTNGKTIHLSDYTGKPVLLNAWATWCPPCRAEMPLLNSYYQAHLKQGFTLLAISAGDSPADALSFSRQYRLAFPVLIDPQAQLLSAMGVRSFPTSIFVGKDGMVKTIHIGMFTQEMIETEISPLLSQ